MLQRGAGMTLWLWLCLGSFVWAQTQVTVQTTAGSNIRSGPGLQFAVLRVAPTGTDLAVGGQSPDGSWLQLQDGAWIYAALVAPRPTALPVVDVSTPPSPPVSISAVEAGEMPDSATLRQQHLAQINDLRAGSGKIPLELGPPGVAQQHALELAAGDYAAHWDRQGLSPYMRYSRGRGDGYSQENIAATAFRSLPPGQCVANDFDYAAWLAESLEGLAASQGHRAALLGDHHQEVQLGLARYCRGVVLVQVLVTDYVTWRRLPRIDNDLLILEGQAADPVRVTGSLTVLVAWEPLPQPHSVHQLAQTGCYGPPLYIAGAVRRHRAGDTLHVTSAHCVTPAATDLEYRISADPAAAGWERQHFLRYAGPHWETYDVPLLARDTWDGYGPRFTLRVEVEDLLEQYGAGIYTVTLWGRVGNSEGILSQYAIPVGPAPAPW